MKSAADDNKYELPGAVDFTGVPANCGPAQYPVRTQVEILLAIYEQGGMDRAVLVSDILKATSTHVAARELDVEAERRERDPRVDDLAALVKQLVRALRKAAPDHALAAGALDYLKRKDLIGSPLRSPAAQVSTEQAGDAWISVEDRLPDESLLRFLVTGRAESGGPLGVHMATLYEGDMYFEGAAESGGCNPCINSVVTHWMPLPGAPSPNNSPVGGKGEQ